MNAPEHAWPADEDARARLLQTLELLDGSGDVALDALVRSASVLAGCPIALVTLLDARRQWFAARVGTTATGTPREQAFCHHAIQHEGLFEVPDARLDPRFASNPMVTGEAAVRFYAGVPLRVQGLALGALCVIDHVPRTLDAAQRRGLADLAEAASHVLAQRHELHALALRQARFRDFAALSVDWLWECDPQGVLTWVGETGHPPADPAGQWQAGRPLPAGPCLDESGQALRPACRFADLLARPAPIERRLAAWDDGSAAPRVLALVARPVTDARGRFCGWRGKAQEVTERLGIEASVRETGARWRAAVDAAGLGLMQAGLPCGPLRLDARAAAMHGLAPAAAGAPLDLESLLPRVAEADREGLRLAFRQAREPGSLPVHARYRVAEGTALVGVVLVRGGDGQGLFGLCSDLSTQAEVERLRHETAAAVAANRAKTLFLSRASHELRTPLNAVLGFAELLSLPGGDHTLSPPQQRFVELIRQAGQRLLWLIDDMLDITRIEQGARAFQATPVELGAAVEHAYSLLLPQAESRQLRFVLRIKPGVPRALADARALDQVLLNLLTNAVKYNRPGGEITVDVLAREAEVRVIVRDEGPGMTEAQRLGLFEPFNRLGAENSAVPGTGLGLAIARSLAQGMGGDLSVSSLPRQGCSFTLSLPVAAGAGAAARAPVAASRPQPLRSVLYVEDDPVNVELVEQLFRQRPAWQLHVAGDGVSGLALARQLRQPPDLVLTDMNLPRMGGAELLAALRCEARLAAVPCIAISADALPGQVAAARRAGFADYWVKPMDLMATLAQLDRWLGPPDAANDQAGPAASLRGQASGLSVLP
jgi:signal transduction histidine kinase/CheY-like chemotaxis protein